MLPYTFSERSGIMKITHRRFQMMSLIDGIELGGIEAMSRSTGLSVAELEWVQTLPAQFPEAAAAERALDAEIDARMVPYPPLSSRASLKARGS